MAKFQSRFFTTKPIKASTYFDRGVMLFLRGKQVASVWPDKTTGLFFVSTVNGKDAELATFAEADNFAWMQGL